MKIGIVNDLPMAAEALRRALAFEPAARGGLGRARRRRSGARCARETPGSGPDGSDHAGHGRRRGHAPDHGQHAVRHPGRDRERRRQRAARLRGDGPRRARRGRHAGARAGDPQDAAAPLLRKIEASAADRQPRQSRTRAAPSRLGATGFAHRLVAIGASAGGPAALRQMLTACRGFPGRDRHRPACRRAIRGRHGRLAERVIGAAGAGGAGRRPPKAGMVLLAGTNDHLILKAAARLGYTAEPRDYVYRPSVDVFFESVPQHWRGEAVGVLLTGMGRDGALGLKALREQGLPHHRAGPGQQRGLRHAQGGGDPRRGGRDSAAGQIAPRLLDICRK